MTKKRIKHTAAFKAKVALAAVQEQESVADLARRHKINANLVYKWKRQLLENLPSVFEGEATGRSETSEREDELLRKIGELTVERDFLFKGLGPSK